MLQIQIAFRTGGDSGGVRVLQLTVSTDAINCISSDRRDSVRKRGNARGNTYNFIVDGAHVVNEPPLAMTQVYKALSQKIQRLLDQG